MEAEFSAATHLVDEAHEVGMRPGGKHQPDMRLVRIVARQVLARQEQLLVDAVDAEIGAVHQTDRLQHVRKERVAPDRRVAQDVPGRHPSGESPGARDLRPAVAEGQVDLLVQEVVPVNQCVQERFPGVPSGDVRKLHLLETRNVGGAHPRIGVQQPLDLVEHLEQRASQVPADVVPSGALPPCEYQLVLGRMPGQRGPAAEQPVP